MANNRTHTTACKTVYLTADVDTGGGGVRKQRVRASSVISDAQRRAPDVGGVVVFIATAAARASRRVPLSARPLEYLNTTPASELQALFFLRGRRGDEAIIGKGSPP